MTLYRNPLALAAVAALAISSMPLGAEVIPRSFSADPLRPTAPRAFGGSRRSRIKGGAMPAGSKLARKAARGKL